MGNNNKNRGRENSSSKYKINHEIKVREIRIIEGLQAGIYNTLDAIIEADKLNMDLVLITENATPPICKVVDFNKFLYKEKQKKKEIEGNQTKVIIKEIKFTPNIGDNDFETKKKKVQEFLEKGNRVKASVFFKGRNVVFKERGELILARLATDLIEVGIPETLPKMEGKNRMEFIIKPKK